MPKQKTRIERAREIIERHDALVTKARLVKDDAVRQIAMEAIKNQVDAELRGLFPSQIITTTTAGTTWLGNASTG